jgi:hypothetical protein
MEVELWEHGASSPIVNPSILSPQVVKHEHSSKAIPLPMTGLSNKGHPSHIPQ